jgi:hypothetical protein
MITKRQIETLRKLEALMRQADLMRVQAGLPALVSGVYELGWGLSTALAGVAIVLKNHDRK